MTESVVLLSISQFVAFFGRSWSRFLHSRSMTHSQLLVDVAAKIELQMALMHAGLRIQFSYLKKLLFWPRRRFSLK